MFRPALIVASLWLATLPGYAQPASDTLDGVERELAQETRLALVERFALARQPALDEAKARTMAARERASGAERLPDPEFKYEQWAVPIKRPYALDRADTLMFGLRQALPAPGARAARGRVVEEEVQIAAHQRETLERDLLLRVRRAYFDYYAADRVLRVHLEHVQVAGQIVGQVQSDYDVGRGNQQDVLKVLVELSRLHNDLAEIRQQRESSRLMLNSLMGRAPAAPLGPPAEIERPQGVPSLAQLDSERMRRRPELAVAARTVRRSEAMLEAAKISALRPSFMVGADYWLMPTQDMPHAYGAMVSMSLPWLNPGRRADVREAEQLVAAERHAARATENVTAFELHDASTRLEAANASLEVIEGSVLPQAEKSLDSTKAAFGVGQASLLSLLDALRSYFQIRLEHSRAVSRVMAQLAAVEFASGTPLLNRTTMEKQP
jgi:cobalt-zinc-cadmium efflux system outer membrane protein